MKLSIGAALGALGLAGFAGALPQISRQGKYLFNPDGQRFYIKGVAYQPQGTLSEATTENEENGGFPEPSDYIDPLSSGANCTRDVPYLQQLGVNTIRVYSVNPRNNHDECMNLLESAGIYVMLDIALPLNGSIDRSSPAWTTNLLDEYTAAITTFNKYDNVLAYTIANEVVTTNANTAAAPFVKAAARDIKAYLRGIGSNALVAYAATDGDAAFRNSMAHYMSCGEESVTVDMYGLNNYEWCGDQNLNSSNWNAITAGFSDIPVVTFMSEFGCITSPPRLWTEVAALYAPPVSDVFSGGLAFSYFPTQDGYGMVTFSGANGATVDTSSDFTRLATQFNATNPPETPTKSSAPSQSTIACPTQNSTWLASTSLPPTPNHDVCDCLNQNAFACRVRNQSANRPPVIGALLDYTCQLLGQSNSGATCEPIGGNGSTGVYGDLSYCNPATKLNYAISAYYEYNPVDSSCDFSGNATLASPRPSNAAAAAAAATSCLAREPSGGVFTPTPSSAQSSNPAQTGNSGGGNGGSGNSGGGGGASTSTGAAAMRVGEVEMGKWAVTVGVSVMGVLGGAWLMV